MNGMCNISQLLFTVLYADDTFVLLNGKSPNFIIESVMLNYNSELHGFNLTSFHLMPLKPIMPFSIEL